MKAKTPRTRQIMDVEMFENNHKHCFNDNKINIDECSHLKRMIQAMKYYSMLKLENSPSNMDIFVDFCQSIYHQLLNDYTHIISTHEPHLEELNRQLMEDNKYGECKHSECAK